MVTKEDRIKAREYANTMASFDSDIIATPKRSNSNQCEGKIL